MSCSTTTSSTEGLPKALCIDGHGQRIYATGSSIKIISSDGKTSSIATEGDVQSLTVTKQGILAAGLTVDILANSPADQH